jgi:hypothetical protein
MPFNIDGNFSVWGLVGRIKARSTLLNHRQTMNLVSYTIENITLLDGEKTRMFAGFQRYSKFIPQIKRYTRMATIAERIYVFGVPDVELPEIPGVIYVPLERYDRLAREWFLVSSSPYFSSALVTQELTETGTLDENRVFEGLWTLEPTMVEILDQWLVRTVDAQGAGPFQSPPDDARRRGYAQVMAERLHKLGQNPKRTDVVRREVAALLTTSVPA